MCRQATKMNMSVRRIDPNGQKMNKIADRLDGPVGVALTKIPDDEQTSVFWFP